MPATCARRNAVVWLAISFCWTACAYAAAPNLAPPSLTDIPVRALAAAVFLALIGGAARTAQKLANPQIVVSSIPMLILADVLTSVAVGSATYFLVAWRAFDPLLQAFAITVAGWGGSTVLENYVGAWARRITGSAKP